MAERIPTRLDSQRALCYTHCEVRNEGVEETLVN
jgi:hypothetical protein